MFSWAIFQMALLRLFQMWFLCLTPGTLTWKPGEELQMLTVISESIFQIIPNYSSGNLTTLPLIWELQEQHFLAPTENMRKIHIEPTFTKIVSPPHPCVSISHQQECISHVLPHGNLLLGKFASQTGNLLPVHVQFEGWSDMDVTDGTWGTTSPSGPQNTRWALMRLDITVPLAVQFHGKWNHPLLNLLEKVIGETFRTEESEGI